MAELKKKIKYSVLTYVFGTYEKLREVKCDIEPDVEYICVTDNENLKSDTWNIVVDHDLSNKGIFDKCFSVRYNPFKYVNSDLCIRIDGSIGIFKSLTPLVDEFEKSGNDALFMLHPYRDNIIVEYNTWIKYRNFPFERAKKHVELLQRLGYDFNKKGMIEIGFNICKNTKLNDDINRVMYSTLKYLGDENDIDRLDQTVITAILDRYFPDIKIFFVGEEIIHSDYLKWFGHNTDNEIGYLPDCVLEPHFRGEKVEIYHLK
jgi:hypothetical protein